MSRFTYRVAEDTCEHYGLLAEKKMMVFTTTRGRKYYDAKDKFSCMDNRFRENFLYCGMDYLRQKIFWAVKNANDEERAGMLKEAEEIAKVVEMVAPRASLKARLRQTIEHLHITGRKIVRGDCR